MRWQKNVGIFGSFLDCRVKRKTVLEREDREMEKRPRKIETLYIILAESDCGRACDFVS